MSNQVLNDKIINYLEGVISRVWKDTGSIDG